jgi:hypothetical protein
MLSAGDDNHVALLASLDDAVVIKAIMMMLRQ